ncbi:MAG: MBOAT family protein [Microthrixaceae bacterium]
MSFALFFVVVLGVSWRLNDRPRAWKLFMLAASYVFYGAWDWRFLGLIAGASAVNFLVAKAMEPRAGAARRAWLIVGLVANLGTLGYFKYYEFFSESLVRLLSPFGLEPHGMVRTVALPVAISFFTFQGISYVVDVFRGDERTYSLLDVGLYLAFFPQLVAGPIVRTSEFMPELHHRRNPDGVDVARAVRLISRGLIKKVVVASFMAELVDPVFAAPGGYGAMTVFVAILAYAIQIYADFSGYTDIAIGVALLLGFHFPDNFDRPYASASIQDFWRRWHMTLSRWLLDYLYIPLGGNQGSKARRYRNLVLTMALGGLWHGASGTFIVWGLYQGFGLAGERWLNDRREAGMPLFGGMRMAWAERRAAVKALAAENAAYDELGYVPVHDEAGGTVDLRSAETTGARREFGGTERVRPTYDTSGLRVEELDRAAGRGPVGHDEVGPGFDEPPLGGGRRRRRRRTDEIPFDDEWRRLRAELEDDRPARTGRPLVVKRALVFAFVCVGWVFFRAPTLGDGFAVLARLFTGWTGGQMLVTPMVLLVIASALAAQYLPTKVGDTLEVGFSRWAPLAQALAFGLLLALVDVLGPQGVAPFIYFQF